MSDTESDPKTDHVAVEPQPGFVYIDRMNREQVIARLRAHEQELRHRGVMHAALFGSVARGEAKPSSDIDILIEIASDVSVDLFAYTGIMRYLRGLFPGHVDVANRDTLKPHVRPSAERDAVYAF